MYKMGYLRMKKYEKRMKFSLCIALCLILCTLVVRTMQNQLNRNRMLQTVGLDESYGLKQVDYSCWRDPLKYGDGYEIMVFASDEKSWIPPANWLDEPEHVGVNTITG